MDSRTFSARQFRSLVCHPDFIDSVIRPYLSLALQPYSTTSSKTRTHALVLSFTLDPTAEPLDPISFFLFERGELESLTKLENHYATSGSADEAPDATSALSTIRTCKLVPRGGDEVGFFEARVKIVGTGFEVRWRLWGAINYPRLSDLSAQPVHEDWREELKNSAEELRRCHISWRQSRLKRHRGEEEVTCYHCKQALPSKKILKCSRCFRAVYCTEKCQREHWKAHKPLCALKTAEHSFTETLALRLPHRIPELAALRSFALALRPEIGTACYSALNLLTTHKLNLTHLLYIKLRPLPGVKDLSIAFEIIDVDIVSHDHFAAAGPFSPYASTQNAKDFTESFRRYFIEEPVENSLGCCSVLVDVTTSSFFGLPLAVVEVGLDKLAPEDECQRRAKFGVRNEGDWLVDLKERAKVSAVRKKEGAVPEMTLREYERWKDGFISA